MRWVRAAWLLLLLLTFGLPAQERAVHVHLDDGVELHGTVVAMDLTMLQVRVGDEVRTIRAEHIRRCWFPPAAAAAGESGGEAAAAAEAPLASGTGDEGPGGPEAAPRRATAPRSVPGDAAADDRGGETTPRQSLLRTRIDRFEGAHPWLRPARPTQWISYGLVLAVLAMCGVHFSVRVAGGEAASWWRSLALAAWYLLTALAQLAMVPGHDLALAAMLLANPTLALFWLTNVFGMPRLNASVAFAVQLGLVALGIGALELVTAVLAATTLPAV